MLKKPSRNEKRTEKQLREHYEIEKGLAYRLRNASKNERRNLYMTLYEELYRLVPHHSQLTQKVSPEMQQLAVKNQMKLLGRLLDKNKSFLEIGPGDCALTFHVASFVKEAYAVDVSKTITDSSNVPCNFKLFLSDGCSIPVPENSIDVVYSNQLMEHLHPDDADEQLRNIVRALSPGGVYLCITPNRLNGPHDVSKYFDAEATGFHLKEYTITELNVLFKEVGFSKVMVYVGGKGKYLRSPISPAVMCERVLEKFPSGFKQMLANSMPCKALLGIRLIGVK